jgi:Flp pilus assembly pilin Flp
MDMVKRFVVQEEGGETAEWSLLVVVLALALLLAGPALQASLQNGFGKIGQAVNSRANQIP